ncbi:phage holin family protein [Paenibacillus sp. N1-5-1-14]|uniref:phage holin family protein n=1 Tax=Paenibacillus radicibacter TaxID=2972488 RepID=UPI0021594E9C|nr:phage holin family protein [Paenibacillus radicibacter]MCR8645595.1 phage holin family protein [Paenibacillus radicibacter]
MNQTVFNFASGFFGTVITYAFGTWNELLSFFVIAILIDIISGVTASMKEGKGISSAVGFKGSVKKVFMFVAILLAHRMDVLMSSDFIMTGAIYFYLANELVSIIENYGRLGLPLPPQIKDMITALKRNSDDKQARS